MSECTISLYTHSLTHSLTLTHTLIYTSTHTGSDASKELQEFAEKTIGTGNYDALAMGGGQQDIAINMLRTAAGNFINTCIVYLVISIISIMTFLTCAIAVVFAVANGGWLCLKNLHLVVAWLPTLEKELSSLKPHPNFR